MQQHNNSWLEMKFEENDEILCLKLKPINGQVILCERTLVSQESNQIITGNFGLEKEGLEIENLR